MQQIFQNLKTGEVTLEELPVPSYGAGQVLIQTTRSLVSLGTEKMLLDFGKAGWLEKARQQPEKVQQVLSKIKTDGLVPTLDAVKRKLDQPLPLGYSAIGKVIGVGKGIVDIKIGDRVVTNGPHAEYATVSRNLVAKIPDEVSDEEAAFTVVGAIGLQGIRLIHPTLGETIVVVGLGLIGLMTVQLLVANGCNVIGFDFDSSKVELAKKYGAKSFVPGGIVDPVQEVLNLSNGIGADGVIITASTSSDQVISQAAQMTRQRGRVVLVGVIGLDLNRSDFYEKEISFQVSCSYGPGRYDPNYEEKGLDYPIGFVRWTEARNFEAVLASMASGRIDVTDLITTRTKLSESPKLYSELGSGKSELGIVIEYPDVEKSLQTTVNYPKAMASSTERTISVLGGGQFAGAVLFPAFQAAGFKFDKLGNRSGGLSPHLAKKYGFTALTSDYSEILNDPSVKSVAITTRHSSHGQLVLDALKKDKHVFVEKPLALTEEEIDAIESFYSSSNKPPVLLVGFNRRFAPLSRDLKKYLQAVDSPKAFVMTVNAGFIPAKHWTQDPSVGGGRLVGEGCHFIDLLRYFSGSKIIDAKVLGMRSECRDTFSIQLEFENGDIGTIHYFANGSKDFPKERLEVFCSGKILLLDNFRSLKGLGFKGLKYALKSQDKGHQAEVEAFAEAVANGVTPIAIDEIIEVSRWAVRLQKDLFQSNG